MALGPLSPVSSQLSTDSPGLSGKRASRSGAIEGLLAVSLCGLAFLLAATPARNSDLWLHLASGRLLNAGRLPDGTEPFSSTTQGVFWVNPTWLSDLLLYQLHERGGGTALAVGKAVLLALVAALWLCFRRRGEGMGMLAVAGFAALLALAPWLLLQPSLLSLLGVVWTLYLLECPSLREGVAAEKARARRWLLVPLFALWANLDGWFVLGPILVGLYALGELLRPSLVGPSGKPDLQGKEFRILALLTLAGLAACLATPYHYRIFAWPTPLGLTHTEQALRHDPLGQTLILSPFGARFAASPVFRSPGAWAYYFLLGASAASFVLMRRNLPPGRLLVWLALAALSIYQARTIPFFAVAAAPLLALNVQEWLSRRPFSESLSRLRIAVARGGLLAGIVLLVLAWPGWLQPAPYQPRGWTAEPDGSLVRLAEQLNRWHEKARFRPDRFALTFSPEVAHHLAWLCPAEKGFLDSRWPLFERVADDYVRMRRCLLQGGTNADAELASLLDAHQIDRILLHDSDWDRIERVYRHLFLASSEWELLAVEGGATVFRRRQEDAPSPRAFDFRRAAYHPALDQRAPPPPRPPQPPGRFDAFLRRSDDRSADREEAALYLLTFDLEAERFAVQWLLAQATGLIGCGAGMEPAATASTLALRLQFTPSLPPSAPESLLLAVRAARRALAVNPDDAGAFLLLGEAYFRLARQTREASWQTMLPTLAPLRQAQILTALEQAVLLRPDLDQAHALLAQLYYEEGQMDRCLDHLHAQLRSAKHRAALQADVEKMEKLVNQSEKTYQANLTGKTDPSKVLERARLAARYGLTRKALEMLLASYPAIFGREGVEYELDLMMQAGQGYQIRDWLEPKHEAQIDFAVYHWLKARAAASCGDYAEADAEVDKGCEPLRQIGLSPELFVPVRSAVALHVTRAMLMRPSVAEGSAGLASALYFQFKGLHPLGGAAELLRQEADRQVLRGLLALECGAVEKAQQQFRAALDLWGSESAATTGAGLDFPTRPIAQEILRRLHE
jgi:tetratricopeptide (TPR) repeat protein